jgi:hypothetical protein
MLGELVILRQNFVVFRGVFPIPASMWYMLNEGMNVEFKEYSFDNNQKMKNSTLNTIRESMFQTYNSV